MARISDLTAHSSVVGYMLETQRRLYDFQNQVSTEKKSQVYSGIAESTERLVNLENERDLTDRYMTSNTVMDVRMDIAETTVGAIETVIKEFKARIDTFQTMPSTDQERIEELQNWAFQALSGMEGYLNTEVDGRYLFAGDRTATKPVDLGLTNKTAFQTTWNGDTVKYPTTRAAHIKESVTVLPAATGNLTFANGAPPTITAATAGAFSNYPVGSTITIAGTTNNDGTYTITGNTGTVLSFSNNVTFNLGVNPDAHTSIVSRDSYYSGDTSSTTHRIDKNRSITLDTNGLDPAFEKAIRAMSIIAQGAYGTAGGLDQNMTRVDDAYYLLDSALDSPTAGTAPYGTELTSNIAEIQFNLAFNRSQMIETMDRQKDFISFLEGSISDIENADMLTAIANLQDQSRALEAAYSAMSRIQQLSLSDFLR